MKIEIWSDFVCPYCYIGKRKLELALDQFPQKNNVRIVNKSYELDPDSKIHPNTSAHAILAEKSGISIEKAREINENVKQQAKEVGLTYYFDTMQQTNTFDAHRLVQYANKVDKGGTLTEALLHAYFTGSENLSDHATLVKLGNSVGLDKNRVLEVLDSRKYRQSVRDDEDQADQIGIEAVPFFVFNEIYGVSGVQSVERLLEVLEKVQEEEEKEAQDSSSALKQTETSYCVGEGCSINPEG